MKVKPPLTFSHESQRLYAALLEQVALNETLQKELMEAAKTITSLVDTVKLQQTEINELKGFK